MKNGSWVCDRDGHQTFVYEGWELFISAYFPRDLRAYGPRSSVPIAVSSQEITVPKGITIPYTVLREIVKFQERVQT